MALEMRELLNSRTLILDNSFQKFSNLVNIVIFMTLVSNLYFLLYDSLGSLYSNLPSAYCSMGPASKGVIFLQGSVINEIWLNFLLVLICVILRNITVANTLCHC